MVLIATAIGVGWVVSPVISLVIDKIESNIEKKYFKNSETEKYLNEMKMSLQEILLIMATVEKQRIEKHEAAQLVQEIKNVVYDAEDVVDEFEYNLLEEKHEKKQKMDSGADAPSSSFSHAAMLAYDTFTEKGKELSEYLDWPILGDGEFKKKVKEVTKSLVRAKDSAEKLLRLMNMNNSYNLQSSKKENWFPTSSHRSEEIIGREEECENLIELLLEKKEGLPSIIQIEGQGGIGKTTLAQMVRDDKRLKGQFDRQMWLTVSENFDMLRLTKEMLKYVSPNFSTSDDTNFDLLQTELEEKLLLNKILLVLDDVWYVKDVNKTSSYEKGWLQFLAPLKNAKAGSKIIVTTREGVLVRIWESFGSVKTISLDGLNDTDGWSLLKLKAFGRRKVHNLQALEPIGEEIVKNLNGFALAIRVVGIELRGKSDVQEWEQILNDNSLDKSDIMDILLRSYEHLPEHLQRCFAYCSLFPKNYSFKPDRLVHMWIAQGFVHPQKQKSSEKIGKYYFNELIDRSFIQVIKRDNKEYYVMHDLMNNLACYVSQGECYRLKEGDTLENLGSIRHLSVTTFRELKHLIKYICGLDKLRTLILLVNCSIDGEFFSIKLKRIRVLDIEWSFEMLRDVSECKHLRYLCFRNFQYKLAPDAFSKLHFLTVLFIRRGRFHAKGLHEELTLPESICNMSRLEFIEISKSIKIVLGGRVQLHSVWRGGSAIFHVDKKKGWELGHLRDFKNIKGMLEIQKLENIASKEEAIKAQLDSKEHVTELWLCWSNSNFTSIEKSNKHNEILEVLRPHPNIERLKISQYPGDKFPSWLESNWLSKMTYISIGGWTSGFKTLPALGLLSQLKKMEIGCLTTVRRISDEFYGNGTFPSLEELLIITMKGLEEWSSPSGVQSFPKLRKLDIWECPDLFSIPEMESFCSLQFVEIRRCPKIRSLPKLPLSLQDLIILEVHHDLEEQIGNKNGQEWDKVAVISGCRCLIYRAGTRYMIQEGRGSRGN